MSAVNVRPIAKSRPTAGRAPKFAKSPVASISFDPDVFAALQNTADEQGISFAESVRRVLRQAIRK